MNRRAQIVLNLLLTLIALGVIGVLEPVTGGLLWIWLLGGAVFFFFLFTLLGMFIRWAIRTAKRSTFHPIGFKSTSSFLEFWIWAVLFAPVCFAFLFALFFAWTSTDPVTTFIINGSPLLCVVPIGIMLILTLVNIPSYLRYKFKQR